MIEALFGDDDVQHFIRGRAALVRRRDKLNAAIEYVDRILDIHQNNSSQNTCIDTAQTHPRSKRSVVTTRFVASVINNSGREWRVDDDFIAAVRAAGWTAKVGNEENTLRAALARAYDQGLVDRVGPGIYGPHAQKSEGKHYRGQYSLPAPEPVDAMMEGE